MEHCVRVLVSWAREKVPPPPQRAAGTAGAVLYRDLSLPNCEAGGTNPQGLTLLSETWQR